MAIDLFKGLNPAQIEAVKTIENPLLVLAGAGSGKTRVLTHKIAYLILEKHFPANSILAMTFTNKAANEMKNRVSRILGMNIDTMWIGTFHSIFARILRQNSLQIGYKQNFSIYDRDDSLNALKTILKQMADGDKLDPRGILGQISKLKNAVLSPADAQKTGNFDEQFQYVYRRYEEDLKSFNAMDFDDLLLKPLIMFKENPEILEKYQNRFNYVLIDEYQDTNLVQFQLAKMICVRHRRLCVVGDEDQAIYGWRGANIENILTFSDTYQNAETIRLEQNYRSYTAILNVANSVVNYNHKRLGKKLYTKRGEGLKPQVLECTTGRKEAEKIFRIISGLIKEEGYRPGDIAILYRTNAHSRLLEDALRNQGISYEIIGGTKFYDRKEVRDALAYLKVLTNPDDFQALMRCLSAPKKGVGEKSLAKILTHARKENISAYSALKHFTEKKLFSAAVLKKLNNFLGTLESASAQNGKGKPEVWVEKLFNNCGLIDFYQKIDEKEKLADTSGSKVPRVDNIYDLVETIREFTIRQGDATVSIESFLQEVQLQTDIDQWNESNDKVTLMTIHQAKGLEFPIIIISGLEQGLLPLSHNFDEPDDLEEERRLFYVAATRAEDKLIMTYAKQRIRYGQTIFSFPSQFIDEISPEFVDIIREKLDQSSWMNRRNRREPMVQSDEPYYDYTDNQISTDNAYTIGMEVNHPSFGDGKIINIEGSGKNSKITVMFYDGYFSKKLVKQYANLQEI